MSSQPVVLRRGPVDLPEPYQVKVERVKELMQARDAMLPALDRTAQVMDGGERAVAALIGQHNDKSLRDMPMTNYMRDAMEAFGSRLAAIPDERVDPPTTGSPDDDNDPKRKAAEKKARIVAHYHDDTMSALAEKMPLLARYVPTASFALWTITPTKVNGYPYPLARLHHPMETMLPPSPPGSQPDDAGVITRIPSRTLKRMFPEHAEAIGNSDYGGDNSGVIDLAKINSAPGLDVVEYYDWHGTWWILPSKGLLLDYIPNKLSGPAFVAMSKLNYRRPRGEFDDMLGPMISYARLLIMAELAVRQDVLAPVNIFGSKPLSGAYKRSGLKAVNEFDANTKVEIPSGTIQFQAWQQLDRIERQMRMEGNSPSQDAGEAPMSFVTGRGLEALNDRVGRAVAEYYELFRAGLQRLDAKLLEYDETHWPEYRKPMAGVRDGAMFEETYVPRIHIAGNYRTRREYGAMASVDEAVRLNGLHIMDAAKWVPKRWIRTQLKNLGVPASTIEGWLRDEMAEQAFFQTLMAHASTPESPEHIPSLQLLVELLPGGEIRNMAEKWLTARGEQPSPEDAQLMAQMAGQGQQQPPPAATVLSRLTSAGRAVGGAQVVGRM